MAQTTIQKPEAIRKGSVRIQVGDSFAALVDIGAIRNPVFTALVGNQTIEFDNVAALQKFSNGKKVSFAFDLAEINLTNLAKLDGGLMQLSTVAGSIQNNVAQVVASGDWNYDTFIPFENQNGDGTKPVIDSVVLGTDGALVLNTDYAVVKQGGVWGIVIRDSSTVTTEAQSVTITTDFTPAASKKITFADSGTKTLKAVRITNTDESGNEFRIDIEDATNTTAPSIDFAGDTEDDVAIMAVTLEGSLVEIVDEQQTT